MMLGQGSDEILDQVLLGLLHFYDDDMMEFAQLISELHSDHVAPGGMNL